MPWSVIVQASFDTREDAKMAITDMEEVVGKYNGDLLESFEEQED